MTLTTSQLLEEIRSAFGSVHVSAIGRNEDGFAVQVPTGRLAHDSVLVAVEPLSGGQWAISDGGATSNLLGADFDETVAGLRCAGAPFEVKGDQLVAITRTSNLVDTVLSYCHHLTAVPVVWHVAMCDSDAGTPETQEPSTSTTAKMVDATVAAITSRLREPHHRAYLSRDQYVVSKGERVRFPLVVSRPKQGASPQLVSTFMDLGAPSAAVRHAKQRTSFLFDVVADYPIPKYVVARGTVSEVGHIADLFDRGNIMVVSDSHQDQLVEDAIGAITAIA